MLGIATGARLAFKTIDRDLDDLHRLGAQAIRWYPNRGRIEGGDWAFADAVVDGCEARGMGVLLGVAATLDGRAMDPAHAQPLGAYAGGLATRYAARTPTLGFEGPNELMLGRNSRHPKYDPDPTPARYLVLQRAMFEAIKTVDAGVLVGLGSIIGAPDWLDGLYKVGAKPFFDFVPYHPYDRPESPTEDVRSGHGGWPAMLDSRKVMRANGDAHKQTWVTEFGTNTGGRGAVSETLQAKDLSDALHRWRRHPWAGPFFNFCGWDADDAGDDPGDWMGLLRADRTEKPAAATFRAFAAA